MAGNRSTAGGKPPAVLVGVALLATLRACSGFCGDSVSVRSTPSAMRLALRCPVRRALGASMVEANNVDSPVTRRYEEKKLARLQALQDDVAKFSAVNRDKESGVSDGMHADCTVPVPQSQPVVVGVHRLARLQL